MRTTVEFPDELLEQARRQASQDGLTLRELLIEALERRLAEREVKRVRRKPPVLKVAPGSPATRLLSPEVVEEAMFGR